jgi:hypothetical protein
MSGFSRSFLRAQTKETWEGIGKESGRLHLREKVIKIGAKVVCHARYIIFQMAEVAVSRELFAAILRRIGKLRLLVEKSG